MKGFHWAIATLILVLAQCAYIAQISPAEHELFEGVLFSFVLRVLYAVAAQAATTCLRKPQC